MRLLALDFDGVVSDSARESFAVALESYLHLRPSSPLPERPREELFREFVERMPLGNRAEDFGATLHAIEHGRPLPDQESYDRYRAALDRDWLARYHETFYAVRKRWSTSDPARWRELMRPYGAFVEALRRRAGQVPYAIATSKDRASVEALLDHYGIADLIPGDRILDKELGGDKSVHLRELSGRTGIALEHTTFVDDKVNHLDRVSPLGVRCALATWGYNGEREHRIAERRGYVVLRLDDVERRLFDAPRRPTSGGTNQDPA